MSLEVLFRVDLPHGRCVGVRVPLEVQDPLLCSLHPEERAYVQSLAPARRPTWFAGRVALHHALTDLDLDQPAILPDSLGAPQLSAPASGSISHKKTLAVGLASRVSPGHATGVDIEFVPSLPAHPGLPGWENRPDISRRVMTPRELENLATLSESERRRAVALCFSIKESLYKALSPTLRRYVSFQEATVLPTMDGNVEVALQLSHAEGPFRVDARWMEIAGHLLTTARIAPVPAKSLAGEPLAP